MKLTRIRLINWHKFCDNTINVKDNTLFSGENGTGKTTILDAIFFVISGGESKMFNKAANEKSTRSVETYMRCKLGKEEQVCLRNDSDLVSHIVLEFFDKKEQTFKLIGAVLEIRGNGEPRSKFYSLDIALDKLCLIKDQHVQTAEDLKERYGKDLFAEMNKSKKQNRSAINKILGLNRNADEIYFDLLKNSIAFNPLQDDVSQFVKRFLLRENSVRIGALQDELRNYKQINNEIGVEKAKKELLEKFIEKAKKFQTNIKEINYFNVLKTECEIQKFINEELVLNKDLENKKIARHNIDIEKQGYEKNRNEYYLILNGLENDKDLENINRLEGQLRELRTQYNDIDKKVAQYEEIFNLEKKQLKMLNLNFDFLKDIKNSNFNLLNEHIDAYLLAKEKFLENTECNMFALNQKNTQLCKEQLDYKNRLDKLQSYLHDYNPDLESLISEIKRYISKKHNIDMNNVFVKPLCECIDISDNQWTNAVEGYLNTQRFDLIVDNQFYNDAITVLDGRKEVTYGVINTKFANGEILPNSLFDKVEILYPQAEGIIKCLLGKVICVDDVVDLSKHKIAISKSCMIYKNYTSRNLNKKAYQTPFIGKESFSKKIDSYKVKIEDLTREISHVTDEFHDLESKVVNIKQSRLNEKISSDYWSIRCNLDKDIVEKESLIKNFKSSCGMIEKLQQKQNAQQKIEDIDSKIIICENKKSRLDGELGALQQKLKVNQECLLEKKKEYSYDKKILIVDEIEFENFKSKYNIDGKTETIAQISQEYSVRQNFNNATKQDIENNMLEYVNNYSRTLFANVGNIPSFVCEYNKILQDNLPSLQSHAKEILKRTMRDFNENFISVIRERIESGKEDLRNINKNLKKHPFGSMQEIYEFTYDKPADQEMREYYRIICSGKDIEKKDLFTETLDEKDTSIINNLFQKLSGSNEGQETNIDYYLDYRNYLSYDIKIKYANGDISWFSKICKEKSGGETQTPFYVIMGSCFDELVNKKEHPDNYCLVTLDEAFNNMDELRIQSLMEYYNELNIQLMIVVPSNRSSNVMEYVDTSVALIAYDNFVETYVIEDGVKNE